MDAKPTSMPCPLSLICINFKPPSLTRTSIEVETATIAFQGMHGGDDDLTRCDLVDDILIQGLDQKSAMTAI